MNCVAGVRPFIVSRKWALFVSNRGMMEKGSEPFYRRPEFSKPVAANRAVGVIKMKSTVAEMTRWNRIKLSMK
jgi:hypothetical protein